MLVCFWNTNMKHHVKQDAVLRAESSNCPPSPPGGRQCRRCASSDTSLTSKVTLTFSHSPFQPQSIFSKFLQALPLGCDCAFHSGREHQDLLPPEGRIVSDTYISQKSQTSQIPCMSDVTDWCQGQLWSFVTQRLANWEPVAGGPALPKVGHQQHLFEFFLIFTFWGLVLWPDF